MTTLSRITVGYKKMKQGKVCEDHKLLVRLKDTVIFAVADGHGDKKCPYAETGAMLAATILGALLKEKRAEAETVLEYGERLNDNRELIMREFVRRWVKAVLLDYREKANDFQSFEGLIAYSDTLYKILDGAIPAKQLRALYEEKHKNDEAIYRITILYGTTINAVVITDQFVFCMGIGDGDIVAVSGDTVNWLLPKSPQFGTTTPSLCWSFNKIEEYFSALYIPVRNKKRGSVIIDNVFDPDLIMIASDGLRNSFLSDDAFAEKLIGISNTCQKNGSEKFVKQAQKWIEKATKNSLYQDDISFCAMVRHEKFPVR